MGRTRVAVSAIAVLIAAASAGAQESTCALSGLVGATGGAPLTEAQVSSSRANVSTLTDSAGKFRLAGLPCGRHEIQVRKIGFTVRRDTLDLMPGQETTRTYGMISVALLDTMKTTADEIHYHVPRLQDFERRRKERISGHFISESDLRKSENVSMPSILRRIPGLQVIHYSGAAYVRTGRGTGSVSGDPPIDPRPGSPKGCWSAVFVDGLMIFDGVPSQHNKPPDVGQFFALNLSGVEFYASGGNTPLQFKSMRSNCGALMFWTRGR